MDIKKESNLATININSEFYLASPSIFARQYFYYMLSIGHFYCKADYSTSRIAGDFDSFLLIYVTKGNLRINNTSIASVGQIALLDCYKPHHYLALEPSEFYYIHFNGNNSKQLIDELFKHFNNGIISIGMDNHIKLLQDIINQLNSNCNISESEISTIIHKILCELNYSNINNYSCKYSPIVDEILAVINKHYTKNISIMNISKLLHISKQHLTRLFNNEVKVSPYQYILKLRMELACILLKTSDKSVQEITESINYSSVSNFIVAFKTLYLMTPTSYRYKYKET